MLADEAPSVSSFIEREATAEQLLEFMVHRSAYQLKEADPHSWALPRLWGRPKAAMVEVQADEYGNGREHGHPRRAVRARDGGGRARLHLRRLPGPDPGRDPGDRQPDVAVRPAPAAARRDRRSSGAVRDDVLGAEPPLRHGPAAARLSARTRACSSTSTSSPTRCTRASRRSTWPAGSPRRTRGSGADMLWGASALLEIDGRWARHVMHAWEGDSSSPAPGARRRVIVTGVARPVRRRWGAKADHVVRPVAERPQARLSAPAQGGGGLTTAQRDLVAVLVHERERAADEQRAVAVGVITVSDQTFAPSFPRRPRKPSHPRVAGPA